MSLGRHIFHWPVLAGMLMLAACGQQNDTAAPGAGQADAAPSADLPAAADGNGDRGPESTAVPVAALEMPYGELEDTLLRGHFVYPESMVEPLPAVIVVHEWWGLNDSIKQAAARLASQGYMVLAVDLYGGEVADSVTRAGELSRELLERTEQADTNLRAAHRFLTEVAGAPRVATLGWSMGGYWSLKAMRLLPGQVSATVVFYGQLDEDEEKIKALDGPVLGLFAGSDRSLPALTVREFRSRAEALGRDVEIFIYPNVDHGFANPDDNAYDAETAKEAWQKTFSFLAKHLRSN